MRHHPQTTAPAEDSLPERAPCRSCPEAVSGFWCDCTEPLSPQSFDNALAFLPSTMQAAVVRFRRIVDRQTALLGKLLVAHALIQRGEPLSLLDRLALLPQGKPFLPEGPHFSISHSAGVVVCVVSEWPVGIDLEQRRPVTTDDFVRYLTARERDALVAADDPQALFFDIWTGKEAVLKADGRGITAELDKVESLQTPVELDGVWWHTRPLEFSAGYSCTLASRHVPDRVTIEQVTARDLVARYVHEDTRPRLPSGSPAHYPSAAEAEPLCRQRAIP